MNSFDQFIWWVDHAKTMLSMKVGHGPTFRCHIVVVIYDQSQRTARQADVLVQKKCDFLVFCHYCHCFFYDICYANSLSYILHISNVLRFFPSARIFFMSIHIWYAKCRHLLAKHCGCWKKGGRERLNRIFRESNSS